MNWLDSLITFEKVAELRSFIAAARALKITNSAVTKRIRWLEDKLSCSLFLRTTRKVLLTDAGEHLAKTIKPLLAEWHDIHSQLIDYQSQPSGEITLCMPPNLTGLPIFTEIFAQFLQQYPQMRLHITNTYKPISLLDENIDILIAPERYVLEPANTVGVKLFDFSYQCYASSSYLEKHDAIQSPKNLAQHNCIIYRDNNQWEFAGKHYTVAGNLRADSGDGLISACVAGVGLVYMPGFMLQAELAQGSIKRVLTKYPTKRDKLMIFYSKHAYKPRKIAVFVELLRDILSIKSSS